MTLIGLGPHRGGNEKRKIGKKTPFHFQAKQSKVHEQEDWFMIFKDTKIKPIDHRTYIRAEAAIYKSHM